MKKYLTLLTMLFVALNTWAAKSIYVPSGWAQQSPGVYYEASSGITWMKNNSRESDNFIVYWDARYPQAPDAYPSTEYYYVDIDDLLRKAEGFYKLECETLGFVDPATSNISKYKIIICLNYTTDWLCTGAGYDFQVPALWLSPMTCKPVGSAVAHEVGHSFHYMCYSEASNHGTNGSVQTGFHSAIGNGSTTWETTANWQALQSYPNEFFTESGMQDVFAMSHNYALTHEWHRYQAYPFFFYLCKRYNDIKTIANVWNYPETSAKDFNEVLMDCKGLSVSDLYAMYYDFATKCVTWDFSPISVPSEQIGNFRYNCIQTGEQTYQVAYSSCPQPTGFNIIPLSGIKAGTPISIDFSSLANKAHLASTDPKQYMNGETRYTNANVTTYNASSGRGFRVGFVSQLNDGSCQYFGGDERICTAAAVSTQNITCTPPANVSKMWMVVTPAPPSYTQHRWNETISDDDQFPYKFTINSGASIDKNKATVTLGYELENANETTFDLTHERIIGTGYTRDDIDITSTISNALDFLGAPSADYCTMYWVNPDGTKIENPVATYDGWSTEDGTAATWGNNTAICTKFFPALNKMEIYTYPDTDTIPGTIYSTTHALTYGGKTAYITLTTTLVSPAENPVSAYTIVGTYNYSAEATPDNTYATTAVSISADAPEIASMLGLSDLASSTFFATVTADGLIDQYTANEGYYFSSKGIVSSWGAGSAFFVETDRASELRFGQMPGACQGGETFTTTVYFGNTLTKQLVQLNLTYKINELPLEDLVVASDEYSYTVSAKPNNDYRTVTIDISADAAQMAEAIGVNSLNDAIFYIIDKDGKFTSEPSANSGFYFNADCQREAWGGDARFFVETDKATVFTVGQMPGTNHGGETYPAALYFGSRTTRKAVKINITYTVEPFALSDITIAKTYDIEVTDDFKTRFGAPKTVEINNEEILTTLDLGGLSLDNMYAKSDEASGYTNTKTATFGFFFDAEGNVQPYGDACKFFIELINAEDGTSALSVDQYPGLMKPEETAKATIYLINLNNQKGVQINLMYTVNKLSIGYITKKIEDMNNEGSNMEMYDINTLINTLLGK